MSTTGPVLKLLRLPIRGGNWNNAGNAGLAALNLNNARTNANSNIGFRPASDYPEGPEGRRLRLPVQSSVERMPVPRRKAKNTHAAGAQYRKGHLSAAYRDATVAKTYSGLMAQIATFDALHAAYMKARRGKRRSLPCRRFEQDLEGSLIQLQNELMWGEYRIGSYRYFLVHEPKTRQVAALEMFRDRVVQHAIMAVIEPIWEGRFISDSYACRTGKGTHAGADRVQAMMRECLRKHGKLYALKADIRKYFASINHAKLKLLLRKRIADQALMNVLDDIIDSYSEQGCPGQGLPIGNLTSQLFANIYLDDFDQWIKCRRQERWYARYMDDFVVLSHDKRHLHALRLDIERWLGENLALETNHKTGVFPVAHKHGRGLDFLGYHLWPDRRRLRKASLRRFKRRVRKLQRDYACGNANLADIHQQLNSMIAHARHGDAMPVIKKTLNSAVFRRAA
jgi:retron-type reverse transcriptase